MRLYNKNGIFDLPEGFVLSLERTNPFFSEDGDSSVPVTLPSTPHNLQLIEHLERIDVKNNGMAKEDAWLTVGSIHVKGTLVIDTLSKSEGIDAVFAFRNGGLYADWRDKTLKEVFDGKVDHFESVADACTHLDDIYHGKVEDSDYTCFPALGMEEENNSIGYTVINQISGGSLLYSARTYYEDGIMMSVPEGYGCTPFIYLHRLVTILFERMGYEVLQNDFEIENQKIVVLNNCVDATLTGDIRYSDMVPDMKVSEFLNWLRDRFMVQAVIDSNNMTAKIISLSMLLGTDEGNGTDLDITDFLIGDVTMRYEQPCRVVITPTVGNGAEAAETSKKKLKERYGWWVPVDESQYWSIVDGKSPDYYDCLIFRRSTGMFYEIRRDLKAGAVILAPIGTNYFVYDRENTENSEAFSPADVIPLMYCGANKAVYPIIGDHIHNHSSFDGMKKNGKQDLIIVREWVDEVTVADRHAFFKRCGTTQSFMPVIDEGYSGFASMGGTTPEDFYSFYWSNYNNILLNGKKSASMRMNFDTHTFLSLDMGFPKTFKNQKLIPVKQSIDIGDRAGNGSAEFVVARQKYDVTDEYISSGAISRLRWVPNTSSQEAFMREVGYWTTGTHYYTFLGEECGPYDPDMYWESYQIDVDYSPFDEIGGEYYLGPPQTVGQQRTFLFEVTIKYTAHCNHWEPDVHHPSGVTSLDFELKRNVGIVFTAQAY